MFNIDDYLEKPYWVIDILPKQVPEKRREAEKQIIDKARQGVREEGQANGKGQYFKVEEYFLEHPRIDAIYGKFTTILLKLNCYEDFDVSEDGEEWSRNPSPKVIESMVSKCMSERSMLYIILKSEDALIVASGDDTFMTVYHPSEEMLELLTSLVVSEGLYIWQPSHRG